ncbi:MAG: diaminopimelate decarboxylase, partial [Clostridiales bacterium]|nr:diaminopimelate decarboxylase [Clostridiales bacterium]
MKKTLPFSWRQLEAIIEKHPTPFHIYDEAAMLANLKRLQKAFAWNKGFKEYFAVKALPNPVIMRVLHEAGCGADCSSYTELMLSEAVGILGEEIMFSSNETPACEYIYARKLGAVINLDDITHIPFLQKNGGIPRAICLRYNPGGSFGYGNTIMGNPGESKYGFTRAQLTAGVKQLMDIGVREFGLHAFLTSNTTDRAYYPALACALFTVAKELRTETGANITFINLSGGIGIPYRPEEEPADIEWIGAAVRRAYEETLVPAGMDVALKAELGRYITGPYGYLVTTAIHEKNIYKQYIGLDACAADLMRPAIYGAYHHISVAGKEDAPCDHVYDVVGSLCENNDKFAIDRPLPRIGIGDRVVLHDTGA